MRKDTFLRKLCAEVMDQRFVGNTVESITANPSVEVAIRERKARCNFRNRPMKGIVEAGKLSCRRKYLLRRRNQRERLRNMQWRKMDCRTQFVDNLRCDQLVPAKFWPAVYNPTAHSHGHGGNVLPDRRSENIKRVALRFVDTLLLNQRLTVARTNVQSAIALPNTVCASGEERQLVFVVVGVVVGAVFRAAIDAELQRR